MNTTRTHAGLAAFALPLLLSLGPQGGASCGGGGGAAPGGTNVGNKGGVEVSTEQRGRGAVAEGTWGGEGVRLKVGAVGAEVEFDCAHGTMGKLVTDASGDFSVGGTFTRERGGPVRSDDPEEEKTPARYSGKVEGKTMTLRLSVEGLDDAPTFTLTHGRAAELRKCL